jgi:PPOX class probable F420-dependent enzyme
VVAGLTPEVEAFVRSRRVARLASVDERGRPHVVPVCFVLDGASVYSALDEKPKRVADSSLRRVRNIVANPEVQLLLDEYDEDWRHLAYVQLGGRAELIESGDEHSTAVRLLRQKYRQYESMDLAVRPVIALRVERATAWGDLAWHNRSQAHHA